MPIGCVNHVSEHPSIISPVHTLLRGAGVYAKRSCQGQTHRLMRSRLKPRGARRRASWYASSSVAWPETVIPRLACAAAGDLDTVLFVSEEHEHVAIARVQGRVVLGDCHPLAELARHAPLPGDAVAEFLDEGVDHVGIVNASVVGAVDGPELVDTAVVI